MSALKSNVFYHNEFTALFNTRNFTTISQLVLQKALYPRHIQIINFLKHKYTRLYDNYSNRAAYIGNLCVIIILAKTVACYRLPVSPDNQRRVQNKGRKKCEGKTQKRLW